MWQNQEMRRGLSFMTASGSFTSVLMKLKLLQERLLLSIFLPYKVRKNQKWLKYHLSRLPSASWLVFQHLGPDGHMFFAFSLVLSFEHVFSFLKLETKLIKLCTFFWIKQVIFLPSRCTSLLLHSELVQKNYIRFLKNFEK